MQPTALPLWFPKYSDMRRIIVAASGLITSPMRRSAIVAISLALPLATSAQAATPAFDDASDPVYDDGWTSGDNGGFGWGSAWNGLSGPASFALATSTLNGDGDTNHDGDIDTGGRAWAVTGGGGSVPYNVTRLFNGVLSVGQTVTVEIDHDSAPDGVGIRLTSSVGEQRFALMWYGSQQSYYAIAGAVSVPMNVSYSDEGVVIEFTLTGADFYSVKVTPIGGSTTTTAGTLGAGVNVKNLTLHGSSTLSETAYFNSIAVPEPSRSLMLVVAWLLLLLLKDLHDRHVTSC